MGLNPVPPLNPDGSLRSYTDEEVGRMRIRTPGVRDGSHPTHVRAPNNCTVKREFFCAYDELESFICYMLGAQKLWTDGSADQHLSRLLPQLYPGKPQIRAVGLDSATGFRFTSRYNEDEDEDEWMVDGVPVYDSWRCTFTYQHCPFTLEDDGEISSEHKRYVIELPSTGSADYITFPGGIVKYAVDGGGEPNGRPIQHNVGLVTTGVTMRRKWIKVPYDAWAEGSKLRKRVYGDIEAGELPYIGTVNKTQIFGHAPGQLLLTNVEDELEFDPLADEQYFNLICTFLVKSPGHNYLYFYSPTGAGNGWHFVSNDGNVYTTGDLPDGKSLFNARDFLNLFLVGDPV